MSSGNPAIELNKEICRELIDNVLSGLAIIQNQKLVYANRSLADIIGYSLEDMLTLSSDDFMSMIYPDDRNKILGAIIDGVSNNKLPLRQEFRIIRKDGNIVWLDSRANFIKFQGKSAMQIAFMDITNRKNAEIEANAAKKELIDREKKLKAIFDFLPIGIYVVNKEGRIIEANQSFIDFMGLSLEELYQKKQWEMKYFSADGTVLPKPKDAHDSLYKNYPAGKAMHEKKPTKYLEIGMEKKNGEIVWAITMGVPTPISDWCALVALMDITEQRKMRENLRIKDAAIEDSIAPLIITNLEGNFIYVNEAVLNLWGYKKEEALRKPAREFWENPREFDEVIDALLKIRYWSGELVSKKKDGSIFNIYLSANLVQDPVGKPLCLIGSILDITDRKKIERELKEREEHFRKIFELSPIGIQLFDAEGFLVNANQASQKIMSMTGAHWQKRYNMFRDIIKNDETQDKLLAGQIINEGKWINLKPVKSTKIERNSTEILSRIYIDYVITPLDVSTGVPHGYMIFLQDLTEQKFAEDALISDNQRLEMIYDLWKARVNISNLKRKFEES